MPLMSMTQFYLRLYDSILLRIPLITKNVSYAKNCLEWVHVRLSRIFLEPSERPRWFLCSNLSVPPATWFLHNRSFRALRPCVSSSTILVIAATTFVSLFRQFIFIVSFTLLLVQCVDYPLLFRSSPEARNVTAKIQFNQVIQSPEQCLRK